jgi:hypothetical protein
VIVAAGDAGVDRAGIDALLAQAGGDVEVIVAERKDRPLASGRDDRRLTVVSLPETASLPRLLGAAIEQAAGDVVAILDAGCPVAEGWVRAVLGAHTAKHPVIGGGVEPEALRTRADWAAYFLDYARFMRPLAPGVARLVPGINVSMKRWALGVGTQYVEGEFWKAHWCRHLEARGWSLRVEPSMVVRYRRRSSLWPLLRQRFHHGRCFAGMRRADTRGARRIAYVLGTPLLPALLLARLLVEVVPRRRRLGQLVLCLPVLGLALAAWSAGELLGYLAGAGASCGHVR